MRLPQDDQFSYNRYLNYLHHKTSEIISLQSEVEEKVRQDERIKLASIAIVKGFDNSTVTDLTDLTMEKTRTNLTKK